MPERRSMEKLFNFGHSLKFGGTSLCDINISLGQFLSGKGLRAKHISKVLGELYEDVA